MDVDEDDSEEELTPSGSESEREKEPEVGYTESTGAPRQALRRECREADAFVAALRSASLDHSGLDRETLARIRNPPRQPRLISAEERAGIRMYIARGDASEANYADNRAAFLELHPDDPLPSYETVKNLVAQLTGVSALHTDMCVNTCVAFTGPFENCAECPRCKESRYDPVDFERGRRVPRRTFVTFPLAPQLQAM
ncbi:hypothetical protein C8T65DRAFT_573536, partial [Cerioporus squamosus]